MNLWDLGVSVLALVLVMAPIPSLNVETACN